jgi:voltage-gated potassium channel
LKDLGVDQALSPDDLVGHTLAKGMEAPHSGDVLMQLVRGEGHRLLEEQVNAGAEVRPLSAVRAERGELVIGVVHEGEVSLGVSNDPDVGPGDYLVLVEPDSSRSTSDQSVRAASTTDPAARYTSSKDR